MNTPILVGTAGALSGASYAIDTQGLRIGRDPNNEVHLDDPDVSRHHARVILYNGALWVQDAGSRNGVFVNEKRISTHKQVGPGDAVRIGTHEFRIDVQVPMHAPPVAQPPQPVQQQAPMRGHATISPQQAPLQVGGQAKPAKKKGFRPMPFIIAGVVVIALIGLVAMRGSGSSTEAPVTTAPVEAETPTGTETTSALLGAFGDGPTEEAPVVAVPDKPTDIFSALDDAAEGRYSASMEDWPEPPEGANLLELKAQAEDYYARQGRLRDALAHYQMAYRVDATCELCLIRIETITKEIKEETQRQYDAGRKYYDAMQYKQAELAFEMVLQLEPDPDKQIHIQTQEYLEGVRNAMKGRF